MNFIFYNLPVKIKREKKYVSKTRIFRLVDYKRSFPIISQKRKKWLMSDYNPSGATLIHVLTAYNQSRILKKIKRKACFVKSLFFIWAGTRKEGPYVFSGFWVFKCTYGVPYLDYRRVFAWSFLKGSSTCLRTAKALARLSFCWSLCDKCLFLICWLIYSFIQKGGYLKTTNFLCHFINTKNILTFDCFQTYAQKAQVQNTI